MRVLFINSRSDALRSPGGDTIQAQKTQAALESLGVTVEVRAANDLQTLPEVDLAHIFNIQEPEPAWTGTTEAGRGGDPGGALADLLGYAGLLVRDGGKQYRLLAAAGPAVG